MTVNMLPEDFKVYVGSDGTVNNVPMPGYEERILTSINKYTGLDGGYIACYSRNKEGSVYSVGDGIYVMGQIRLQGQYIKRIFYPQGYENQDISAAQEFKDLCNETFPACKGDGWAGGDTGGWFGLRPDSPDERDKTFDIPISISLPASVDLREWCSPIEDQGKINSCTAHAAVTLFEYFQKRSSGKYLDLSRLFLYKVTRNLLHWKGDVGASSRATMKALALLGVPQEEFWPYDETKFDEEPPAFCYALASKYTATKYYRVDTQGRTRDIVLQQIKASLAANRPLMFGILSYTNTWEQAKSNGGKIPFPSSFDSQWGGHNMAAVGYDDNIKIKNTDPTGIETTGAFLVKNSYGIKWGDGGYGWLPYEYVLKRRSMDWWTIMEAEWLDTGEFEPKKS
ncbi:MAG TPA: C1 family peptidase [Nodularia sp. (in: cyanobacteria)]|nr:C1 family peptidase [Nodularia sp. (in: cyanobacteria)]